MGISFDGNLKDHMKKFVGETVTIFTKSGGASGCGFTGVVLDINDCFVRLLTCLGPAPTCPISNSCGGRCNFRRSTTWRNLGSVVDIPIDSIASFVHNAV